MKSKDIGSNQISTKAQNEETTIIVVDPGLPSDAEYMQYNHKVLFSMEVHGKYVAYCYWLFSMKITLILPPSLNLILTPKWIHGK